MTKDPYVRFWIEDGVEVATCTAVDFRGAMNERARLRAALERICRLFEVNDDTLADALLIATRALDRDKDG